MNWVDFVRGVGDIVVILIIAGLVAYIGDRVGHQVGRRRLTLFGIRPRYTSTLIAVGTGVFIALVVTLIAILASQQVQTAFFRLSALDAQIRTLTSQEHRLEQKVEMGRLVVPTQSLMAPLGVVLQQSQTRAQQERVLRAFYLQTVQYINANYPKIGLRPYRAPSDVDARLHDFLDRPLLQSLLSRSKVVLIAIADQNLYVNDEIHFAIAPVPDVRTFAKGQLIFGLKIPGASGASIASAIGQLEARVVAKAVYAGMPPQLADNVQPTEFVPSPPEMQEMLRNSGSYYLVAYASQDIYPDLGGVNIQIALVPQKP